MSVIREIERQATAAWGSDLQRGPFAAAAFDYMRVVIPASDSTLQSQQIANQEVIEVMHVDPVEGLVYTDTKKRRR